VLKNIKAILRYKRFFKTNNDLANKLSFFTLPRANIAVALQNALLIPPGLG
jgi:hypothetical protein